VDHIAVNQDNRAQFLRKIGHSITHLPSMELLRERLRMRGEREGVSELLAKAFPGQGFRGTMHNVEHHFAHLSSAFHVSPFEEAVVLSVDAFGDFSSTAWGIGSGSDLSVDGRVYFPHSLGIFYQALTQYPGFPHYGDEYKVMGRSVWSTGSPRCDAEDCLSKTRRNLQARSRIFWSSDEPALWLEKRNTRGLGSFYACARKPSWSQTQARCPP
jgi:predicted NodU family carbamoyl transferase